jgi:hypothetical protein
MGLLVLGGCSTEKLLALGDSTWYCPLTVESPNIELVDRWWDLPGLGGWRAQTL